MRRAERYGWVCGRDRPRHRPRPLGPVGIWKLGKFGIRHSAFSIQKVAVILRKRTVSVAVLTLLPAPGSAAEVARVEVTCAPDVVGGRRVGRWLRSSSAGRVYFIINPESPRNKVVADLNKALRRTRQCELSADLSILSRRTRRTGTS